jgi:very-short-patch-repair endonuclease
MVDFLWREERLAVQIDGPGRPFRNFDERGADLALAAAGYRVIHLTEREVDEEPNRVVALLRRELQPTQIPDTLWSVRHSTLCSSDRRCG